MDSSTTHVQQVSGGRPPEGGLVAEVSADDNEVLSEEQEVERKGGTMRDCDVIPASILKALPHTYSTYAARMGPN